MILTRSSHKSRGFSVSDLLIVLLTVIIAVFFLLLLPALVRPGRVKRASCIHNLKQVGLSFDLWASDNGNTFPMAVSTNKGGTREYNETPEVFRHFLALSYQLNTLKILVCPNDAKRSPAPSFDSRFSNKNISYFVGLDAKEIDPQMILTGDRNVTGGVATIANLMRFASNSPAGWSKEIHRGVGYIGLADGTVQQATDTALRGRLQFMTNGTIRLAIP